MNLKLKLLSNTISSSTELTERHEGVDEWVPAVDALVASSDIHERVGCGTAVAKRLMLLIVLKRLRSNLERGEIHVLLSYRCIKAIAEYAFKSLDPK